MNPTSIPVAPPGLKGCAIEMKDLTMTYGGHGGTHEVLKQLDLVIDAGEFVAVTGPSGCGKSTLLNLLGALDRPTSGELRVDHLELHEISERDRVRYRRERVGFVFQFFNLLPTLDVLDNVALPLRLQGDSTSKAREQAIELVSLVGLHDRKHDFPSTLSGGEMQRAAVARSLVHRPGLLLADEPTGNLDSKNAEVVLSIFEEIHARGSTTLVLVTHSQEVADRAGREIRMRTGHLDISP